MTESEAETMIRRLEGAAVAVAQAQDWPGAAKDPAYHAAIDELDEARGAILAVLVRP